MIHNYKYLILSLLLSAWTNIAQAQSITQHSYTLQDNESGAAKAYIARDYVLLKPGFNYAASGTNTFNAKIDAALIFPPTSSTYAMPDGTITTNPTQGAVVGSIPGQFGVSPTGAANYSIPIECPAGINVMQPNISLVYNSQGGSGTAGIGWGITGLSAIGRTVKNIFSDDAVSGLDLSKNEKYTLDGNALLALTGIYGNDGATYQTENKTYSIIKSQNQTQSGGLSTYPLSFNVTTKDGQRIEYSNLVNPVQNSIDRNGNPAFILSQPLQWLISKVTDTNGNFMTFSYIEEAGIIPTIKSITYGDISIEYDYDQKQVIQKSFMNGYYLLDKYLLRHIRIVSKGTTIKQYDLSYNYDSQKERYFLKDVALSGQDNIKLNSTKIEWGADYKTINTSTTLFPNTSSYWSEESNRNFTSSDIDGDGFSELIEFFHRNDYNYRYNDKDYSMSSSADYVRVHKMKSENGVVSFDKTLSTYTIGGAFAFSDFKALNAGGFFADFNGNSKKTIIAPTYLKDPDGTEYVRFRDVYSGVFYDQRLSLSSEMTAYAIGDINNDGIDEIISMEKTYFGRLPRPSEIILYVNKKDRSNNNLSSNDVLLHDELNFDGIISTDGRSSTGGKLKNIFLADFNGDGLKDLMITTDLGCFFMRNNGGIKGADGIVHVTFTEMKDNIITDFNSDYSTIKIGDFNGDGLVDFVLNEHCNANWKLAINNGRWGFDHYPLANFSAVEEDKTDRNDDKEDCIVTDFNHDGKSDIILIDPIYYDASKWYESSYYKLDKTNTTWYASTGTAFDVVHTTSTTDDTYTYNRFNTVGDFDGDGKEDVFSFGSDLYSGNEKTDNKGFLYSTFNTNPSAGDFNANFEANQVKSITNGMGAKTSVTYQPLTYNKDFYTPGSGSVYPVADIVAPINCVLNVKQPIDNVNISTTQYTYSGAKVQVTGRGFLGFTSQTVSNATNNIQVVSTTELEYPYCLPKTQTVVTSALTQGTEISRKEATISNTKSTDNVFTSLPAKTIEKNSLNDLSKTTEYVHYDDWGNLIDIKTTQGDLTITQTMGYGQFGSWAWCLNKPVSNVSTSKLIGDPVEYTRTKTYDYDPTTGNLITEIDDPDDAENKVTTSYSEFDTWGHPQTVSVTTPTIATARTSHVKYTDSGRFIANKINLLGEKTSYTWNETRAVLDNEADNQNRLTSYTYNGLGQLTETKYPNGIRKTDVLQWASPDNTLGAKYYSYSETSGSAPVQIWYDALGRELAKETYGLNEKKISVFTKYLDNGKVDKVSEPTFATTIDKVSETEWAAKYAYADPYGRVTSVITPTGETKTEYLDSEKKVKVTSSEGTNITVLNNIGQTYTSMVNDKTVTYSYYPSVLTKTSTPEGGQALTMEYNLQGKRTKLIDPDGGTVESKYNGFGELLWEKQKVHIGKDPIITTNTYLDNGLLDKIVRGIGTKTETTSYTYDADPKHVSRIKSIEIAGKNKQSFNYDDWDRVTNVEETIGTKVYNHQTEYDFYGRVSKDIYPSGYYTMNTYDTYGNLSEVKDEKRSIWKAIDANARGQLLHESKGGKVTEFNFDERGLPTGITADGVVKAGYSFNTKGNLEYRTDDLTGQREDFLYDNQNRLTNWDISKNGTLLKQNSMAYNDTTSNITSKSDLGDFTFGYGGNRPAPDNSAIGPHALTSISGIPSSFPQAEPNYPTAELKVSYTDFKKIATLSEKNT